MEKSNVKFCYLGNSCIKITSPGGIRIVSDPYGEEIPDGLTELPADLAGDVVTIEPGIYLEGFGGLRVEDDCIVTENAAEWLTRSVDPGFLQAL